MRLLQLHTEFIEYEPVSKEVAQAELAKSEKQRFEELVVLFVSVERGDNENVARRAVEEVKTSLQKLKVDQVLIYPYSHLSSDLADPNDALKVIEMMEGYAREAGLKVSRAPFGWTKAFQIKIKGHPLAEQSKSIISQATVEQELVSQAVKAEEKLISQWFILTPDGDLVPAAKFDFSGHTSLQKLAAYEMAKVRGVQQVPPHVTLMKRLSIADYEPGSDAGNLRYYPKGRLIKSLLEQYVTSEVKDYGGLEVETPIMYDATHPALASYLNRFPARQYTVRSEEKELFLRFSACFGQFLIAKDLQLSHKHLPFKIYELTKYSFRREKSGEVTGLRRLRTFTMPDCHCLCTDLEQAKKEFHTRFLLSKKVLHGIELEPGDYELAIRFTREFYDANKEFIVSLVKEVHRPALIEMWQERFFYFIMKWEFNFIDNLDKASALSTDQIDVENAERFGITFVDENGNRRSPVILHNSPSGAIERCMYALLEKAFKVQSAGGIPSLPIWLSPVQVRIVPVSASYLAGAVALSEKLAHANIRVDVDDREESVAKRIREAEMEWIPFVLVYGEKEAKGGPIQLRDRQIGKIESTSLGELIQKLADSCAGKPFLPLPLSKLVSERPTFT